VALAGANIVDAKIVTLADGMALDTLSVLDPSGREFSDETRLQRLKQKIEDVLRGRIRLAREAIERVGLGHLADHPARVLSGGEQQRVALARAWALRPQVLFLDEPTASLDPTAAREIEAAILAIHTTGTKIVMTTHNLGQAHRLGDEILFLHQGRLVERAPADRFLKHPASPEAAQFLEGELPW